MPGLFVNGSWSKGCCSNALGLDSMEGEPNDIVLPASLHESSTDTKKSFLKNVSLKVVDKFILHQDQMNEINADTDKENENYVGILSDGRFPCRFTGCNKTLEHDGTHGLNIPLQRPETRLTTNQFPTCIY